MLSDAAAKGQRGWGRENLGNQDDGVRFRGRFELQPVKDGREGVIPTLVRQSDQV
jgi:hypothetical protein